MKVNVDLHIHTALSGCASDENTVANVVNMCQLLGKQIIALSDHNSAANVQAAITLAAASGILVVPAMEVTTAEEVHMLCLFKTLEGASTLSEEIASSIPKYPLDLRFYNPQRVFDAEDNVIKTIPYLLNVACSYDVYALTERVAALGGIAIPAHIDRETNSIIAVLGVLPRDLPFTAIELSSRADDQTIEAYKSNYRIITSSDAHCLEDLCNQHCQLELEQVSIDALFDYLEGR